MRSAGHSGSITRLTPKYFCLATGLTAVHLDTSSFLGFRGIMRDDPQRLIDISLATASANSITALRVQPAIQTNALGCPKAPLGGLLHWGTNRPLDAEWARSPSAWGRAKKASQKPTPAIAV